jgi:hypothetical protein
LADERKPLILPKDPYLPFTREQNPAPFSTEGQQGVRTLRNIVDAILRNFQQVLPSNYVAEVPGPFYVLQFQAAAEQLAQIQLQLEEVGLESDVDFARPDYLWQMIGTLVFPDTNVSPQGIPEVDGDLTYREFLRRMILLLLQGATQATQQEGLSLLTTAVVEVLSKVDYSHSPTSGWGLADQHEFEINLLSRTVFTDPTTGELIQGELGTGFPEDPVKLLRNNQRILRALKPAGALYEYRHLFKDTFGSLFAFEPFFQLDAWYYYDFRRFCCGMKELTGSAGATLSGRVLFSDVTRDFRSVPEGATLEILAGPNSKPTSGGLDSSTLGRYRVVGVMRMPSGAEATPRPYTTSPTGLSGTVTIGDGGVLTDAAQDFSDAVEGETLTILAGPNAGQYRLETLIGNSGGPVGQVPPGSDVTGVRVAPCIMQLRSRMPQVATGQAYRVSLERLGVQTPYTVLGEDASAQFFL